MGIQNFQVLIVDDNEINRDMLSRRLHRKDFDLSMATSGKDVLKMVKTNFYDLILLDIMMPEIDGYTVLKYLKEDPQLCNISVIMISGLDEMDSVMKCMEIGADDYLTKPFDPEMLKAAIDRCLADKKKVPELKTIQNPTQTFNFDIADTRIADAQITDFKLPDDTTRGTPTSNISLDEVVHRIMQTGVITRKGYLYFSKAIFNILFENSGLTEQEVYQIRNVFEAIQSGRLKVVDTHSPSRF
jgi:CheY-like chemotaxis protein